MAPRVTLLVGLLLDVLLLAGSALAQAPADDLFSYTNKQVFYIPFQSDPGERRLKEVQLYYSMDQGRSWQPYANVPPDQGRFKFTAERDGVFWFTVRTIDLEGRAYPVKVEGARPGLKVCVDTRPPTLDLRVLPARDGMVGVAWEIHDDNLDLSRLRLDARPPGAAEWRQLRVEPVASGQHVWTPETNGPLEVRLIASDLAGNVADKTITLAGGQGDPRSADDPARRDAEPSPAPGGPAIRMVNSKRISLNYQIREKGPSGVSVVELWYTQDGRNWQKYGDKPEDPPYVFDVNDEGLYGFSLVVRSGVGLGDRPPRVGDPPQVWVEVDVTKPIVQVQRVDVGRGTDTGKLTILYTAKDKNLGRQPVTLSYAESPTGPWKPIAANVENTGRYVWQMPTDVPYQFLVRVEAADRAGNVGVDETPRPVIVDLSQPKGVILDVAPGK